MKKKTQLSRYERKISIKTNKVSKCVNKCFLNEINVGNFFLQTAGKYKYMVLHCHNKENIFIKKNEMELRAEFKILIVVILNANKRDLSLNVVSVLAGV